MGRLSRMRRLLDTLYSAGAGLAALSLLGIFGIMMAQVVMRELQLQLPAADDLSAYLCVSTTFFALAATFRRGELIRVGMLLDKLSPRPAPRWPSWRVLALAAALMAYVTFWTAQDMLFSWEIEEVAQGTVPIPLWIPKLAVPARRPGCCWSPSSTNSSPCCAAPSRATWWPRKSAPPPATSRRRYSAPWIC